MRSGFPSIFAAFALGAVALAQPRQSTQVLPNSLPPPYATPAVDNHSVVVPRPAGVLPQVPKGFAIEPYVTRLSNPRFMALLPNGDVLVTESSADKVTVLRNGRPSTFATGFRNPSGIAFHAGAVYVGDLDAVWRLTYKDGALTAGGRTRVTRESFGYGGHSTRDIAFGPDGALYLAIGSKNNVAVEPAPRATVQRVLSDGHLTTFAAGLRNPVGIAFYPGTDDLYVTVNERDGLGDKLPPDYFARVRNGDFFGWPFAYIGSHPDPNFGSKNPVLVAKTRTPDVLFQAHSAPLGFTFYDNAQFPPEYKGGAFIALHGSWNRSDPAGYKVVFVKFMNNRPENRYIDFVTGFLSGGPEPPKVYGRPSGVLVAADGSLLIADDTGNTIWRVRYAGK